MSTLRFKCLPVHLPLLSMLALSLFILMGLDSLHAQNRALTVVAKPIAGTTVIGRQIAIFIAVDRYREWNPLRKPVTDARALKEILSRRYYLDETYELYDEQATRTGIMKLFEYLIDDAKPEDSIFIYYAGHGHLDTLTQTGSWIPQDSGTDTYTQLNWLPNAQVRALIGRMKSRHVVLVSDSCFSGDILDLNRAAPPTIDNDYFRKAFARRSRQVLTSVATGPSPDQSPFSLALLRSLEENTEPYLDPQMLYSQILLSVKDPAMMPLLGVLKDTQTQEGGSFIFFLKDLRVQSGSLLIEAPATVQVTLRAGDYSLSLRGGEHADGIPPGRYEISARGTGSEEQRSSIEIVSDRTATWKPSVPARQERAMLELALEPADTICYVDSPVLMQLSSGRTVELNPGSYLLRLEREGYRDQVRQLSLEPGRQTRLAATLELLKPGSLELPSSVVELKLRQRGEDIDPAMVPAGVDLSLTIESPQAVSLALPPLRLRLNEGESRSVALPSGRFLLPRLPAGSRVSVGGREVNSVAGITQPGVFESPDLPVGIYEVKIEGSLSWTGRVTTKEGARTEVAGYREAALAGLALRKTEVEAKLATIPTRRSRGWLSLLGGCVGAAGSVASYILGQQATDDYMTARYPEEIEAAREKIALFGTILPAAAVLGGLGFILAPVFWSGTNDAALRESLRQLDESIRKLTSF